MWHDEPEGEEKWVPAPFLPVSFAVAASSAFPPLFPPIRISHVDLRCGESKFPIPQLLTDGGVYDNLGIDRFLWYQQSESRDIDIFLVSDAEAGFSWDLKTPYHLPLGRNVRASDLLMKRISSLTYQVAERSSEQIVPVSISETIKRPPDKNVLPIDVQNSIGGVRTDLDAFSDHEIRLLVRQGFAAAREAAIRHQLIAAESAPDYQWEPLQRVRSTPLAPLHSSRRIGLWFASDWTSWALILVASVWLIVLAAAWRVVYELIRPETIP